jgi:hypothetical protein
MYEDQRGDDGFSEERGSNGGGAAPCPREEAAHPGCLHREERRLFDLRYDYSICAVRGNGGDALLDGGAALRTKVAPALCMWERRWRLQRRRWIWTRGGTAATLVGEQTSGPCGETRARRAAKCRWRVGRIVG